ncbi:hypothetical protein ACS0TY_007379 [Phlomoides rotata]
MANPEEDDLYFIPVCWIDYMDRWRPETHTFHFPVGEVTVTLQDVTIICGLSIEGELVVCREPNRTKEDWHQYYQQWLGFRPLDSEMRSKTTILLNSLSDRLKYVPEIDEHTP